MPVEEPKDYVPRKPGVIALTVAALAIVALCVIAAGLVLARNSQLRRAANEIEADLEQGPRVLVTQVRMAPRQRVLEIPGGTTGHDESPVYAKLPGYMKKIYVDKGDRVKRGQLLARAGVARDRQAGDSSPRRLRPAKGHRRPQPAAGQVGRGARRKPRTNRMRRCCAPRRCSPNSKRCKPTK